MLDVFRHVQRFNEERELMPTKKTKNPTMTLTRPDVVTAHFALVNYISQLKAEIRTPTRSHGAAESAMALTDAEPLLEKVDQWLAENQR